MSLKTHYKLKVKGHSNLHIPKNNTEDKWEAACTLLTLLLLCVMFIYKLD